MLSIFTPGRRPAALAILGLLTLSGTLPAQDRMPDWRHLEWQRMQMARMQQQQPNRQIAAEERRGQAEARRARVEREIAAFQQQQREAKDRYNQMIYGGTMFHGHQAHLDAAAHYEHL